MDNPLDLFEERSLTQLDLEYFLEVQQKFKQTFGNQRCWCLRSVLKGAVKGFSVSHSTRPSYKGQDARVLTLAAVGRYPEKEKTMMVRRHACNSVYCINPEHYYWGTKQDICFERGWRKNSKVTPELVKELRQKYENENTSLASLSKSYRLPYYVVRGICKYIVYV